MTSLALGSILNLLWAVGINACPEEESHHASGHNHVEENLVEESHANHSSEEHRHSLEDPPVNGNEEDRCEFCNFSLSLLISNTHINSPKEDHSLTAVSAPSSPVTCDLKPISPLLPSPDPPPPNHSPLLFCPLLL